MMTTDQARVVDMVLTNHVRGYTNAQFVGGSLFPRVPVPTRGGQAIEFGVEAFYRYAARRAPGANVAQIDFGYEGKPYKLVQDALDARVPREHLQDASKVPGIDLGMRATNVVMKALSLALEIEQAQIATDAANYEADHKLIVGAGGKWTDPASDPIKQIEDGIEVVRASTGLYPNVLTLAPKPYKAFKSHPKVLERFKGISADALTPAKIAALLDIASVQVGAAVVADAPAAGQRPSFTDVWGAHAVLACVPSAPEGREEPSFGYTYALDGNPYVEQPYWVQERRSWLYGVTYERVPVLTGMAAGYLIHNAT
ncbi:major capsid protein [Azospirillum doebereinerae]